MSILERLEDVAKMFYSKPCEALEAALLILKESQELDQSLSENRILLA